MSEIRSTLPEISIGEDVKPAFHLLLDSPVGALIEGHQIGALLFSQALLARSLLSFVTNAVTGLLVPLSLVLLLQTLRILDSHVQGVVHEAIQLYGDRQFLYFILSMRLGLDISRIDKGLFLALVAIFTLEYVIVVSGPVLLRGIGLLHLNVDGLFVVVVLEVPVRDNVVLTNAKLLNVLASDSFRSIGRGTFVRRCKVMFLHRLVADDIPVNVCILARAEVPRLLLGVVRPLF